MNRRLHFDFETYSDLDLTVVGTGNYARHPSTEVLMCAWSWGDPNEVDQWVPAEIGEPIPNELEDALLDDRVMKFAWNANFERNICKHVMGIDIPMHCWRDPMVLAFSLSFPGKLEKAGPIVDLETDKTKDRRGKLLIRKFCAPRTPTKTKPWTRADWTTDPVAWAEFLAYNRQDVVAEVSFWKKCWQYDLPEHEWELWQLDQEINEAGIPINMEMVNNAQRIYENALAIRMQRLVEITSLDNPNAPAQLLPWLQDHGYPYEDLKKGHVKRAIGEVRRDIERHGAEPVSLALLEALELRAETAKTSVKKYAALRDVAQDSGLFRHAFQFAGAGRTWRWAGRKVQYHNAPRPPGFLEKSQADVARHIECLTPTEFEALYCQPEELVTPTGRIVRMKSVVMDALSTGIRPAVQAPDGYIFADADLNAIENRVLGWMAQDPKILHVFANDLDPYIDFATHMLGGTYEERWHEYKVLENKEPRTLSKPAVLGCGYRLGAGDSYENKRTGEIEATGLLGYAWNMGVTQFTKEQSELAVKVWRETFKEAVEFWKRIEKASIRCVRTGEPVECWPVVFDRKGPFLRMRLPSGRYLHYCRPRLEMKKMPWGEEKLTLTYENLDDKNQWGRITTHGGKLTENADQAISRDLLAYGMRLAHKEGLDIRLHIHDQLVAMVLERQSNWGLATLLDCMKAQPPWAPDMPLGAAGALSKYFVKD